MPKIQDLKKVVDAYYEQLKTKLQQLVEEVYEDEDNNHYYLVTKDGLRVGIFERKSPDDNNKTAAYKTYAEATALTDQISKLITSTDKGHAIEGIDKKFVTNLFNRNKPNYQATSMTQAGINYLVSQPKKAPQIDRLLHRFAAMSDLKKELNNKTQITPAIETQVNSTVQICQKNRPTWSEKPFLDKLKDFFSLGINLIFYKDDTEEFVENVENVKPSPRGR